MSFYDPHLVPMSEFEFKPGNWMPPSLLPLCLSLAKEKDPLRLLLVRGTYWLHLPIVLGVSVRPSRTTTRGYGRKISTICN